MTPGAQVRLFQAVSLGNDIEGAKGLAYSLASLREGVARIENAELELTAIVEPRTQISDTEQYGFGVGVMESAGLRVLTLSDMGRVAETARRELRV